MIKESCIFCNIKRNDLFDFVVSDSQNFWVILDGFPITEPHFLIIPKVHRENYSYVPIRQFSEIEKLLLQLNKFIPRENFFAFEHGSIGQSVKHAHLHVIPLGISLENILKTMRIPGKEKNIKNLRDIKGYRKYFFFFSKGRFTIFLPNQTATEPAIITNTIAKLLHLPFPANKRRALPKNIVSKYVI